MTCYEILTRKLSFEGHKVTDYDLLLNGQHLELPHYVDEWICELPYINAGNPTLWPSFYEILSLLDAKLSQEQEEKMFISKDADACTVSNQEDGDKAEHFSSISREFL